MPDSYHYKRRLHLYDTATRAQTETRGVDTSDLTVTEEDWFSDEAAATLLGYAEKEVMGHKVKSRTEECDAFTTRLHGEFASGGGIK